MHHADTRTFLRYYLSRRINKNLPAIIRGLNPEDDIMSAPCRVSRSIDPNRPQELTTAQSSCVNQDPGTADLIRRRDELSCQMRRPLSTHHGTEQYTMYKELNQEIAGARQRTRNALLTQIQAKYDHKPPMLESDVSCLDSARPRKKDLSNVQKRYHCLRSD